MRQHHDLCASLAGLSLLISGAAPLQDRHEPPRGKADDLAWMSGSWVFEQDGRVTEEHWTRPAGGTLIGMARTVKEGRTVFFEYLRIEETADGLAYVAQPMGKPPVRFMLTRLEDRMAVFENPQHDAPKKISYQAIGSEKLTATTEGGMPAEAFAYVRAGEAQRIP